MTTHLTHGDCVEEMARLPAGSVDLVFADPPFNIGYEYDAFPDRLPRDQYFDWTVEWLATAADILSPRGSLWVAINDENVGIVDGYLQNIGLRRRNWIIWKYTFGVHCEKKFGRDHTHLLYFVKDPKNFTFNADAIRVPSIRQTKYNDKRANPKGRVPGDVWEFPRVCGTSEERQKWHPCQMPEALLERVIKACSNPGDTVLDPFLGSGTTLAVARRLGRNGIGFDISEDYVSKARQRVASVTEERMEERP